MGRFTLRLPETLHKELEERAQLEGISLNQYIVYTLTRQIASSYQVQILPEASIREQRTRYDALLAKLGQTSTAETVAFLLEREEVDSELPVDVVARLKARITQQESDHN